MLNRYVESTPFDRDPEAGIGRKETDNRWKWYHVVLILAILFPYISIFALFGMVSNQKSSTKNYYTTASVSTSSFPASMTSRSLSTGTAVSFTSTGDIQPGGGTSLYLDIAPSLQTQCPAYPSLVAVNNHTYLLSTADKESEKSSLQLVKVTPTSTAATGSVVYSAVVDYYIYELALLPESDNIFVAVCQDTSSTDETAYLVAGHVNLAAPIITLSTAALYAQTYSVNPTLIGMSETGFLLGYYYNSPASLALIYGEVSYSATAFTITISTPFIYSSNSAYSNFINLAPLSETTFMLMLVNNTTPYDNDGSGALQVTLGSVDPSVLATTPDAVVTLGNYTELEGSAVSYYFAAAAVDGDTVLVAYANAAEDYALTVQAVQVLNQTADTGLESLVAFGASWTVNTGRVFDGNLGTGLQDLDLAVVSTAGDFIVLYADYSNDGTLTATLGQLTASGEISRASPDFLLQSSNPALESVSAWGAMAAGVSTPFASQTALVTFLGSTTDCAVMAETSFALLERLPAPVGVLSAATSASATSTTVGFTGVVEGVSEKLTPGKVYYSTTRGGLVASAEYAGRGATGYCVPSDSTSSSSSEECLPYVYNSATKTIVTKDSAVGLALTSSSLNLITSSSWTA